MRKTGLLTFLLVCLSLPAYAWQLQTRVAGTGGKVSYSVEVVDLDPATRKPRYVLNTADPNPANWTATAVTKTVSPEYTSANRTVSLTLPDSKPESVKVGQSVYRVVGPYPVPERVSVTITPGAGFQLSQVYLDGLRQPLPSDPASPCTYELAKQGSKALKVSFAKQTNTITARAVGKGTVSPSGSKAFEVGASRSYAFSPQKGQRVVAIDGLAALAGRPGVNLTVTDQATRAPLARSGDELLTEVNRKVVVAFKVPGAAAVELVGRFGLFDLTTSGPMTVRRPAVGTTSVTLRADATRIPLGANLTYRWTQTAGPTPKLIPDLKPGRSVDLSVTAATAPGTYGFTVVAAAGTATVTAETYVVVTEDLVDASKAQCEICHKAMNLGEELFAAWGLSAHATDASPAIMCYTCHVGADSDEHPGQAVTNATCSGCHAAGGPTPANHGSDCLGCHDPHSLTAEVPGECAVCHDATPEGPAAKWIGSKHDTASPEVGCAGCHTGQTHPPPTPTASVCLGCHGTMHGLDPAVTGCLACHDAHSAKAGLTGECAACHGAGSGTPAAKWTGSKHDASPQEVGCAACHSGTQHRGNLPTNGVCTACHGTVHGAQAAVTACLTCHDAHSLKATSGRDCSLCHATASAVWSTSRHATSPLNIACQVCHLGLEHPGRIPSQALCVACHGTIHGPQAAVTACLTCHDPHSLMARTQGECAVCHGDERGNWTGSKHDDAPQEVGCATCHSAADHSAALPTQSLCIGCHGAEHGTQSPLTSCLVCHDEHTLAAPEMAAPHMGGMPLVQAQYVSAASLRVSCAACHAHGDTAANPEILDEFKASGHADVTSGAWMRSDWRAVDRGACQRCHTGAGFVAKLGNEGDASSAFAAGDAGGAGEVLNCSACHSDLVTGALRSPGAFTLYGSNGAGVAYPDVGPSNLCVRCHGGRENGESIGNDPRSVGRADFIDPHALAAAGTLFHTAGYRFAGPEDGDLGFHRYVGIGNVFETGTGGPCVACHMTSGQSGHTWEVVRKDGAGAILAPRSALCEKCHGGLTGAVLEEAKQRFLATLLALRTTLEAVGIYFHDAPPYFYAGPEGASGPFTDWGSVYGDAKWKDVMGAAFNYALLAHDPGAYAHNRQYALKLIADSCDFLADGRVDGVGIPPSVSSAIQSTRFAAETNHPAALVAMANSVTCAACHGGSPHYGGAPLAQAQYVSGASLPVSCANCHPGGNDTVANAAILAEFAASGHGDLGREAWAGEDWRAASRAACARCHNGSAYAAKLGAETDAAPVFSPGDAGKPGEVLNCEACHLDVATGAIRTAGAYTATYSWGQSLALPDLGASNLCVRCHSALESGGSIKADPDPTGIRTFINPHSAATSQVLWNRGGYQFGTLSYRPLGLVHQVLGLQDSPYAGPCVTCHMGRPGQRADHSWQVVEKDGDGRMTALKSDTCQECHYDDGFILTITPELLAARKQGFEAALSCLEQKLGAKGIHYYPASPYFFTAPYVPGGSNIGFTSWSGVYGNANDAYEPGLLNWKNVMGAAFNLKLLRDDSGAYAHNQRYARRLVYDSINFIDNGVLDATLDLTGYPEAADYLKRDQASIAAVPRP